MLKTNVTNMSKTGGYSAQWVHKQQTQTQAETQTQTQTQTQTKTQTQTQADANARRVPCDGDAATST
jgi:hypothetical protein